MHCRCNAPHHLDRTGSTGHDSGPQATEIELGKVRMPQLRDEHGRYTINCGTPFGLDRTQYGQWLKQLGCVDHGGAVGEAAEITHHHAKAVIESSLIYT